MRRCLLTALFAFVPMGLMLPIAQADDSTDPLIALMIGGTGMPTPSEFWQDTIVVLVTLVVSMPICCIAELATNFLKQNFPLPCRAVTFDNFTGANGLRRRHPPHGSSHLRGRGTAVARVVSNA